MADVKLQIKGIEALKARLNEKRELILNYLNMRLSQLGEECVTYSKDNKGYKDRTGNLKNSISYALFLDGELITTVIGVIPAPEANSNGQEYVEKSIENYARANNCIAPKGYTLIVVAGMDYARHVENKGYNVLHLTKYFLREQMGEIFKQLMEELKK